MALGAPKPVKAVLQAELDSLLAVALLISTCLCLVGAALGLLLCGASAVLLCTVDAALWVAACAAEACISLLNQGTTIGCAPPNLATDLEMLRPPCPIFSPQPLTKKPGHAACSPPCSEQKELIKSWSKAANSGHLGSIGEEDVKCDVTPLESPRCHSEEIKGPDTPAATQQLSAASTSTKGSPRPGVDFAQDVDCTSQSPSTGVHSDREIDGGCEVKKSMCELAAEVVPPMDVLAVAAVAAVAVMPQPTTPPSTDVISNFDLVMFGSKAEEAEKADSAQPPTHLKNQISDGHTSSTAAAHQPQPVGPVQGDKTESAKVEVVDSDQMSQSTVLQALPGLPDEFGSAEAALLAPGRACTPCPAKPTATVATAKAPGKTIKGRKVLEAVRLLENRAKTGGPTRDSVLLKVVPERILATIQGRGQHSVRNLSLQFDRRTDCTTTVLPMPPTAHALCSAAASMARWNRQSRGKFRCH